MVLLCFQWSHQFELLNYSEFGTTVDDVRYACDVSVVSRSMSSRRLSRQRPSSTNSGVDELRQLMTSHASSTQDKNEDRTVGLPAVKPVRWYHSTPPWTPSACYIVTEVHKISSVVNKGIQLITIVGLYFETCGECDG